MRFENADRFAGLNEQCFVFIQLAKLAQDCVKAFPVSRGFSTSTVDDQIVGIEGHIRVEIVLNHPVSGLDQPVLTREFGAGWGFNNAFGHG
jgi:hypothetical protein